MNKSRKAFTFIEIIIAIFIIAIIGSIITVSLPKTRSKAKDLQRINDITEIRLALELYYRDTKTYPHHLIAGEALINPLNPNIVYLEKIPRNPSYLKNNPCPNNDYFYYYHPDNYYFLEFCLENPSKEYALGENCATFEFISDGQCL